MLRVRVLWSVTREQRQRLFHPLDFYYLFRVAAVGCLMLRGKMRRRCHFLMMFSRRSAENVNQAPTKKNLKKFEFSSPPQRRVFHIHTSLDSEMKNEQQQMFIFSILRPHFVVSYHPLQIQTRRWNPTWLSFAGGGWKREGVCVHIQQCFQLT